MKVYLVKRDVEYEGGWVIAIYATEASAEDRVLAELVKHPRATFQDKEGRLGNSKAFEWYSVEEWEVEGASQQA